jgi:hypothetical protein
MPDAAWAWTTTERPGAAKQPPQPAFHPHAAHLQPRLQARQVAEVLVDVEQVPDDDHHTDDLEGSAEVLDRLRVHGRAG